LRIIGCPAQHPWRAKGLACPPSGNSADQFIALSRQQGRKKGLKIFSPAAALQKKSKKIQKKFRLRQAFIVFRPYVLWF
jgi:hypothetical protein